MTYNILNGGGAGLVDPGPDGNRLPRIIEVIKAANPDIVGIEEANKWQLNNEAIAKEVAEALGMNYYIGLAGPRDGHNVVLFTKFEIIEAESYPYQFIEPTGFRTTRGALHAELLTNTGETMHVFVVHLKVRAPEMSELEYLIEQLQPYQNDLTVLMGDMNFVSRGPKAERLREAGWEHPESTMVAIDQIWTSPSLAPYLRPSTRIPPHLTQGTSDHIPVVREIWLFSPVQGEEE